MKRSFLVSSLLLAVLALSFANCGGGSKVSAAECEPVVNSMFDKLSKELKDEQKAEAEKMKMVLMPQMQKECESGKFDLNCLKNASNIAALQACKK